MSKTAKTKAPSLLGPPVGYTDLLDYEITEKLKREEEEKRSGTRRFNPLRPSAAGYCGRRLAYDLMSYRGHAHYPQELKEPNVYRLLELGHSVEYSALRNFELIKIVQPKYKQQTLSFFRIERLDKGTQGELIEGSCDVVLYSPEWKCVMDVKSQKDGFSSYRSTRWDETLAKYDAMSSLTKISDTAWWADDLEAFLEELGDDFLADNLYQLNLYACSDFLRERGIDHASIYKYNKNDSRHYELRFRPSMAVYERVRDKFNRVSVAVDAKAPENVARDSSLGSMRCAFCPYASQCWEGDMDAKKAWWNTLPAKQWPKDTTKLGAVGKELEEGFAKFEKAEAAAKAKTKIEEKLTHILATEKINKVRLNNNEVYELKFLKSPRPHYEIRRSKA